MTLHAWAAVIDLGGLAVLLLQARFLIPADQADPRIMVMALVVPLVSLAVFAIVPRRVAAPGDEAFPRLSLPVYLNLGGPAAVTLLTLVLVAVSGSFDSFAGFVLLVAVDAGRNLREWLRLLIAGRAQDRVRPG